MSEQNKVEDEKENLSLADKKDLMVAQVEKMTAQIENWKQQVLMAQGYIQCLNEMMQETVESPSLEVVKKED